MFLKNELINWTSKNIIIWLIDIESLGSASVKNVLYKMSKQKRSI